jgi:hypothetical protein
VRESRTNVVDAAGGATNVHLPSMQMNSRPGGAPPQDATGGAWMALVGVAIGAAAGAETGIKG